MLIEPSVWPWWWSAMLGLAWASFLWLPAGDTSSVRCLLLSLLSGGLTIVALTLFTILGHQIPLGLVDHPDTHRGTVALIGMGVLYFAISVLQSRPLAIETWRRWSYAGYYVDERYTRLILKWKSNSWMPRHSLPKGIPVANPGSIAAR
jgi:NAD(P)H-quinone oxidoreductase subunit 5